MHIRRTALAALAVAASGCAPGPYLRDLDADHPANPRAAAAPVASSRTLALDEQVEPEAAEQEKKGGAGPHHGGGAVVSEPGGDSREASDGGAALYRCPMHRGVTARDPKRRCPKCNMKINKPVGESRAPSGRADHEG